MNKLEIIPIEYGKSVLPESMIFQGGAEDKFRPIVFMIYLIKTEKQLILVDAGCETMPGFDMRDFIGPVKALEKIDIKPDDITDVIITHSHHDHIECVSRFKNAVIYIQRDEYESGKGYLAEGMNIKLFDDEMQVSDGVRAVKIGGHSKGSCIVEVTDDKKTYIISGDECYLRECLDKKIPTGTSYCPEKSREFIEKYSSGEYTVLLCHDK
ncbi:MAG: N-acyl homoserine lactonase family protein [Clostridiales bacterium]|nr:N-acyl homoserine lactonase family protein [Clostridiales bacterium]